MTLISKQINALLEEIIHEIISEEVPVVTDDNTNPLIGALKKTKQKIRQSNQDPKTMLSQEQQVDALINKLLARRKGRATLNRSDIEKLDLFTRWMVFLPFGKAYRKGLAKYLRSRKDGPKKHDPFRDFRRYTYDDHYFGESIEPGDEVPGMNEQTDNQVYYHGTNLPDLKPGSLILAPSKTGRMSEKGRLKNLDVVFFTKDPGSAKIYADRAVHSFGGGVATVYIIEPQGPVTTINDTPGTTVFHAPYAKVITKVNLKKKIKP